jgi:2-oxoglutarate/2-oxoacid ferredoxin oxidoreductase subunit alpha
VVSSDMVVRIGGEGGEGVISLGEILTTAVSRGGLNIHSFRTFPAEIRGGLCMFQLRGSSRPALSLKQKVDVFLAFNQEAYDAYVGNIKDGGLLVFDPALTRIDDKLAGRNHVELPLEKICEEVTGGKRSKNMVGLGAMLYFFDIPVKYAHELIQEKFGSKGDDVVGLNIKAVDAGHGYALEHFKAYHREFERQPDRKQIIITGNEAVALGALAAGVDFIGGYPITPATPIFEYLCKELPKFGGVAIQLEDEIASLASVIGASYAGKRAMTATSGPGLALMSETLNLAAMTELPLVIANVMRGGPSTGLPTKTEQSDLKLAIYGTSGESPRCIMAPLNIEDAFYQTVRAFRIAEKYQMPVILLTDQAMAYSSMNIAMPDLSKLDLGERKLPGADATRANFDRFQDTEDGISPIPIPGVHDLPYMGTGLEHNEHGDPNYTPDNHVKMTAKRFRKLEALGTKIDNTSFHEEEGAEIGVIGWGSTHGAITEAIEMVEAEVGIKIAQFHPRIISPLREWKVRQFLGPLKKVIVPEENYTGQFAHFLKAKFGIKPIEVHKADGIPITSEELYKAFKEAL